MITEDSLPPTFPFVCVVFLPWCIYLSAHSWSLLCAPRSQVGHHTDWRTDASIRKKVAPLIVRAEARFTPLDAGALAANLHKISRCRVIVAGPLLLDSYHHYLAWSYAYKTAKKPESSQQVPPSLQDRRSYQLCHCDLRKSTRNLLNKEGNGHRWSILQESNRIPPYCNKGFHKDYQRNVNTNNMCSSRLQLQSQLHIVVVALMNWFCRHSRETTKSSSVSIFCLVRWALSKIVSRGRE